MMQKVMLTADDISEQNIITQRLAETVAWCQSHATVADPAKSTRTADLEPAKPFAICHTGGRQNEYTSADEQRQLVTEVCMMRARKLSELNIPILPIGPNLAGGRFLIFHIDGSDWCCVSGIESLGYFDDLDVPGWDTWVHYFKHGTYGSCLLCWVPPQLVNLAQGGIFVNPVECIQFVEYHEIIAT